MKIADVLFSTGMSGFFNYDYQALRLGGDRDGFVFRGEALTEGFDSPVQVGESLSVMLVTDRGDVAIGDCVAVIFAGLAGRDPLFRPERVKHAALHLRERLLGRELRGFRELSRLVDEPLPDGSLAHTALRYGFSQALLHGVALAQGKPMATVIAGEYGTQIAASTVALLVNSPVHDPLHVDRIILKQAELLPHGSFTNAQRDLGQGGEKLLSYAQRVVQRIKAIGPVGYNPQIHLDVYGTLGEMLDHDIARLVEFLRAVCDVVHPYRLIVESPFIMGTRDEQIRTYQEIRTAIDRSGLPVEVVVDEWCNTLDDVVAFSDAQSGHYLQVKMPDLGGVHHTIEAVLYAKRKGLKVSLGGSLNETDVSTRVSTHVAMATQPDYLFAKPGYGGDEAMMMIRNEMRRIVVLNAVAPERMPGAAQGRP